MTRSRVGDRISGIRESVRGRIRSRRAHPQQGVAFCCNNAVCGDVGTDRQ